MTIIIDAYNLLKTIEGKNRIDSSVREHYLYQCLNYQRKKGHSLVMVFDGNEFPILRPEIKETLNIVFSGNLATADDYIVSFLRKNPQAQSIVVTSDRTLQQRVEEFNIAVINVYVFYKKIKHSLETGNKKNSFQDTKPIKLSAEYCQELDNLMASINYMAKPDDFFEEHDESHYSKKSKHETKIDQILKKL